MTITKRIMLLVALTIMPLMIFGAAAEAQEFFNGFESDTNGWDVFGGTFDAVRVASGTNGIASASGDWHAEAQSLVGIPAGNWGGYSGNPACASTDCAAGSFPTNGYITAVDIYLDVTGGLVNDTRMDFTSAINKPDGNHRRDFAFNTGFYNDADGSPGSGSNRFVISASNNTGRNNSYPKNPDRDPVAITATGWYTFQHKFYDIGGGVLAVELSIIDTSNVVIQTWTLTDPTDIIGTTIGGNRYGWFAANELSVLAFDNTLRSGIDAVCDPSDPADRAPESGSGTQADPYVIADCCQLQGIADYNGKYYVLDNDIDCSDTVNWNSGAGFIPLGGNGGLIYSGGGLDGQGYVISDLYINDALYTGFFARTSNVEFRNFGLENADISGSYLVGGVASNAYNGTSISEVYVTGSISGSSTTVGGIVGSAGTGFKIKDSYFVGQVTGTAVLGGLIGVATNTNGIENCYANVAVTGTSHSVGGLVGNFGGAIYPAAISNSFATGTVENGTYTYKVGGLVGYLAAGGSVSNSYWDNDKDICIGLDLGVASDCKLANPDESQFYSNCNEPELQWDFVDVWAFDDDTMDSLPCLRWEDCDYADVCTLEVCEYADPADRAPESGSGTQADPYVITDCCELQGIADFNGKYYVLDNDIDCSDTVNWNDGAGFKPIGGNNGLIYVRGGLDGQSHTINDLYINKNGAYTGLYARVYNVEISNFNLENADISGSSIIVGGIAGNAYGTGSSISEVNVSGSVSGISSVGGIVGSAGTGFTLKNSSFLEGKVSGTTSVGGAVGVATNINVIDNCYSNAWVYGTSHSVGGLVGNFGGTASTVMDSCAEGNVDTGSYTFKVGGLIGYLSKGSVSGLNWANNKVNCIGYDLTGAPACGTACP